MKREEEKIPHCTVTFWIIWKITVLLTWLFFRLEVYGRKRIPKTGGVMLASNHASYLDPVVIGDGCPRPCHFLAREDLFEIPGIRGWLISRLHTHGIKRDSADRRALQKSRKVLDGGHVLVSFPEGKRTRDGELMPAKPGIGWIALNSNCAVVPTYVQGAFEAWPRHEKKFKWTKVRVFYGKPLYFEDLKKKIRFSKEDYEDASNRIMDQIKHLKKVAPPLTKES